MSEELREKFLVWASPNPDRPKAEMNKSELRRMFDACGVYKRPTFTSNDTDIAFNKVRTPGSLTITFAGFQKLLDQLEKERRVVRADAEVKILATERKYPTPRFATT